MTDASFCVTSRYAFLPSYLLIFAGFAIRKRLGNQYLGFRVPEFDSVVLSAIKLRSCTLHFFPISAEQLDIKSSTSFRKRY
jgi:hypothetical protein